MHVTIQLILLALFVFATLAAGAVHVWAYSIVFGVTFFLSAIVLLFSGISILRNRTKPPSSHQGDSFPIEFRNPFFWLLLAFILLIVFQLVPLSYPVLDILSPFTANLYRQAHEITTMDGGHSICSSAGYLSLDRGLTVKSLLTFCAYLAFAFLVTWSVRGSRDLRRIAVTLITFASILALYGCLVFLDDSTGIFGWKRPSLYGGRIASTLINPDHFASYLIMAIFLTFGYFCSVLKSLPSTPGRTRWRRLLHILNTEDSPLPKAVLLFFLMAIMLLTLVYTLSRGGVAALFISMVLCLLLLFLRTLKPLYLLLALPLAAVLGYYIELMGVDLLLQRLADTQRELAAIDSYQRMILFLRGLDLWQTFPLFGVGLGAFPIIFPMVQPADLAIYDIPYIHNDWLQLAIETGWMGALLILLLFAFLFIECLMRWWKTENPWGFGFGLAALGTMVAIAIHELVDFSLRIPSNPLFLVIVLALARVGLGARNRSRSTESTGARHSLAAGSVCFIAAAAVMFLSFQTAKFGLAERYCPTEKSSVNVMQSELRSSMVRKALALDPLNSEYYQMLVVGGLLDQSEGLSDDERGGVEPTAEWALGMALCLSPARADTWQGWGEYLWESFKTGERTDPAIIERVPEAFRMALLLNPGSLSAHKKVVEYLLWRWKQLVIEGVPEDRIQADVIEPLGRSLQIIETHIPGYHKAFASLLKQMNLPESKLRQVLKEK